LFPDSFVPPFFDLEELFTAKKTTARSINNRAADLRESFRGNAARAGKMWVEVLGAVCAVIRMWECSPTKLAREAETRGKPEPRIAYWPHLSHREKNVTDCYVQYKVFYNLSIIFFSIFIFL
jgi:hypothetical protein